MWIRQLLGQPNQRCLQWLLTKSFSLTKIFQLVAISVEWQIVASSYVDGNHMYVSVYQTYKRFRWTHELYRMLEQKVTFTVSLILGTFSGAPLPLGSIYACTISESGPLGRLHGKACYLSYICVARWNQWCIGGYTRVYAVYQPPGFFDSVYSPQWS